MWSSQEWKSGEMLGARTVRPVDDKFVIDDDRLRKILDHSSKGAMQDIDKRSMIWERLCLRHWKHLYSWERITQKIYIPSKIQEKISQ